MGAQLRKRIEELEGLSRSEKAVLSVMADYANDQGENVWPGRRTIARRA